MARRARRSRIGAAEGAEDWRTAECPNVLIFAEKTPKH
jgi:hypothetical protein